MTMVMYNQNSIDYRLKIRYKSNVNIKEYNYDLLLNEPQVLYRLGV